MYSNCINKQFTITALGGQECTDSVNVQQNGDNVIGRDRTAIIPRLNFTCNGRITSIQARIWRSSSSSRDRSDTLFQVWRRASAGSTMHSKIGEVQLLDDQVTRGSSNYWEANIILTGNNIIEVQSGDVVGYYHPPDARYRVRTIRTDGYILYQFNGSPDSVDHNDIIGYDNYRQPLIQFTIGKCVVH